MLHKKNILTCIIVIIFSFAVNNFSFAETSLKSNLDNIINTNKITSTTLVSVSIRDVKTSKIVYDHFGNYYLHTASILKAITTPLAFYYLGLESKISTTLLQSTANGNVYLKLSGDPLLTGKELNELFKEAKENGLSKVNGDIILDSSLIDNLPWGVGWLWDDENESLMPKYNAFNIDHNLITVKVKPSKLNMSPEVTLEPECNFKIVNQAKSSNTNQVSIERRPWLSPEDIYVSGKVSKLSQRTLPVGNNEKYFVCKLKKALEVNNISLTGNILDGTCPSKVEKIASIDHKLTEMVAHTNQQSDNLAAETLLKIVGAKYSKSQGTTKNGLAALKSFYTKIGAPSESQEIVDGSGASHNNLLQANWITLAFSKLYTQPFYNVYKESLAQAGDKGTLSYRMKALKGKLYGKTGTLAGISGVAGYLTSKSGKTYAVAILIQNFRGPKAPVKQLEDTIFKTIYNY